MAQSLAMRSSAVALLFEPYTLPLTGGQAMVLAQLPTDQRALIANATSVFAIGMTAVQVVDKATGVVTPLSLDIVPDAWAVSDSHLYLEDQSTAAVWRYALDGGEPLRLVADG